MSLQDQVWGAAAGPPAPDPVRQLDYLRSLRDLVARRVLQRPGGADTVTVQMLAVQFHQPFSDIVSGAIPAVDQPVHPVRIAIEVLRSYLNALNVPDPVRAALAGAEAEYRLKAYQALLTSIGSSYDEIRLVRDPNSPERLRLAQRLGIPPDDLPALLLTDRIPEAALEQVFGLVDTRRDLHRKPPDPQLLVARKAYLRSVWAAQDHPADPQAAAARAPLIDPDLIGSDEVVQPSSAFQLWQARSKWVTDQLTGLRKDNRDGETAVARFDRLVNTTLGEATLGQLQQLAAELAAGHDVRPQLGRLGLAFEAFSYLMRLRTLAPAGLLDAEWEDFYSILVQTLKVRGADQWRREETQLTVGPDLFRLSPVGVAPALPAWRASVQARRVWENQLQARISQESALVEALRAAVAAVEDTVLPLLRDALVAAVGQVVAAGRPQDQTADLLTARLFIDFAGTGLQQTTRVGQAIETMQGVLFALRSGRLQNLTPELGTTPLATWRITSTADFDREWEWLGSYPTWRTADEMFLYPENDLRSTLRGTPGHSLEFQSQLVDKLADEFPVTAAAADDAFKNYVDGVRGKVGMPAGFDFRDLAARREQSKSLIPTYPTSAQQLSNYLWEVFYDTPMYVAERLQESGEFAAALDYYQLVYAFNLPAGDGRYIFSLLKLEQTLTSRFDRGEWLLHLLNPHDVAVAQTRTRAYTQFVAQSVVQCLLDFADARFTADTAESLAAARGLYLQALDLLDDADLQEPTGDGSRPANPAVWALRQHAQANLIKLRGGRNIAGLRRVSTAAPQTAAGSTPAPVVVAPQATPYRYATLIDRAKQLVALAQQTEAAFLAALEKQDAETYNLLKAGADLGLAQAQVQVHDLRIVEATDGVALAGLQRERAQDLHDTYTDWINQGVIGSERVLLDSYAEARRAQDQAAAAETQLTTAQGFGGFFASLANPAAAVGAYLGGIVTGLMAEQRERAIVQLNAAQQQVQLASFQASYDRRRQEWQLQQNLAAKDVEIAAEQIQAARDHVVTVTAERAVAQLQVDHDRTLVEFLAKKFTNADLYRWMSGVLMRVYGYFLQQATATARLAQSQLAFERQEPPASFIQIDYKRTPERAAGTSPNGETPNRLGLTGSARLLQDIYRLDQYAFDTNKRKLQLTKTLSLARLTPQEFQRFRETGVLPFTTPMALFDADFPGHYLRLIRRVRTSLIALIPPTHGVKATLSSAGISRVVLGPPTFQAGLVARQPEAVALTSPSNATGLFELDTQPELLLPFEGMGVDGSWELQLPKPANSFDYTTIADVLVSIDYTAVASPDYRDLVIERLADTARADRAFSFRDDFPDQWYELHNPDQSAHPMQVAIRSQPDDFPTNLADLTITDLLLYLVPATEAPLEVELTLTYTPATTAPPPAPLGGPARTIQGVASTARGNAAAWQPIIGQPPVGEWTLTLPTAGDDGAKVREAFHNDQVRDILLLVSYTGHTPPWPGQPQPQP